MPLPDDYSHLPPRVDSTRLVEEVEPYVAVEEIRGARRVSPYSPVAGIDEARLYAELATAPTTSRRRRMARAVVYYSLASFAVWVAGELVMTVAPLLR